MRAWELTAIGLALLAGGAWAARSVQVQRVPGPGTGIVTVTGEVNVANRPTVMAAQQGEWKVLAADVVPVTVSSMPAVTVTFPIALKKGSRYEIVWPAGEREVILVADGGRTPWVRVERDGAGAARWVNVSAARAIAEVP